MSTAHPAPHKYSGVSHVPVLHMLCVRSHLLESLGLAPAFGLGRALGSEALHHCF